MFLVYRLKESEDMEFNAQFGIAASEVGSQLMYEELNFWIRSGCM
jgi:hypothetical protein